jgi:hypothetical protein
LKFRPSILVEIAHRLSDVRAFTTRFSFAILSPSSCSTLRSFVFLSIAVAISRHVASVSCSVECPRPICFAKMRMQNIASIVAQPPLPSTSDPFLTLNTFMQNYCPSARVVPSLSIPPLPTSRCSPSVHPLLATPYIRPTPHSITMPLFSQSLASLASLATRFLEEQPCLQCAPE